ncbi:MAG: M3 family metallopeptidase [bacterium]
MTANLANPLLSTFEFIPYQSIKAEHIYPATVEITKQAQAKLEEILATKGELNFENAMYPLIEMEDLVDKTWTPVENLLSLNADDDFRDEAEKARPVMVEFYNNYSLDPRVYEFVKRYAESEDAKKLTGERKRYLENTLKDFKLSGAELEGADREEFKELNLKLSQLSQKFSNNVVDSKFDLIIKNKEDLAGLPEDLIQAAALKAKENGIESAWVFNLDYPSYGPFMKFSDNGALRKTLYIEYLTRASAGKKSKKNESLDNEPLIFDIFAAKARKAKLLGFPTYADLSLQMKMAESPKQVKEFLIRLAEKARALAEKEYSELISFQKSINYHNTENNPDKILPWDTAYLSEKLRKEKYDFDTNLTKPYFELNATIEGMFNIAKTLYSIDFQKVENIEVWHEDVSVYQVLEKDGSIIGTFYMDLYPREVKRSGAWVMPLVDSAINPSGKKNRPQCVLVCNLTKPQLEPNYSPSLLTHLEVLTLFHEFGHALHHLLSNVELSPMAGTNVEWDFVELPSQLNENFVWQKESLSTFAKHYETAQPIPNDLLDKMLAARNFNEGLSCLRQVEFALFDLEIYMNKDESLSESPNLTHLRIARKYNLIDPSDLICFPNSFSHIFAGGYASGYYSYKWAEVLEADAFSRFQDEGVLNPAVGAEYRKNILEKGDSEPPLSLFKAFMGREPDENALLKRMGL